MFSVLLNIILKDGVTTYTYINTQTHTNIHDITCKMCILLLMLSRRESRTAEVTACEQLQAHTWYAIIPSKVPMGVSMGEGLWTPRII